MQYIHVKVTAKAKKELFKQKNEDHFEISVREPAERNMANTRIIQIMSEHFKVLKGKVRITNGHRSPSKLLVVEE